MFSAEAVLTTRINHLGVVLGLQIARHRAMWGCSAQIGTNARIKTCILTVYCRHQNKVRATFK